ncbi:YbfB/YjiJ family MFS transporter [Tatumella sp. UBA2305]|uniref:YbfB/YjiJ family MFS transporter n=1 Tax=Tatumella sp. UBA2305 TaxID=1947647 RepID=UPI0025FC70CC|nr:YbfB/YjiJ family MFS transporter [Tatumella sp. UBA2305]
MMALAGAVVLVTGMGYGRFAFTGIMPLMIQEHLMTLSQGNLAAAANYAGYLAGALLLAKARPGDARLLCFFAVITTLLCLFALAISHSGMQVIVVRGIAGLVSAVSLIAASLWLLQHHKHSGGAPLLYAGVGVGIFLSAEVIAVAKQLQLTSPIIWVICGISAAILFLLVLRWLNLPADSLSFKAESALSHGAPRLQARSAAYRLLLIYALSGFGYIITATYLPLFLSGSPVDPIQVWALFGLAAIPSCFIWHKWMVVKGARHALIANLLVQAVGVVLPAFSHSLWLCLVSALLTGFTFMGTVTIALPEARRLAHLVSFNMIAAMTALYGLGQIAGPLVAGELYQISGSFSPSLFSATAALLVAVLLAVIR